MLRQRRRSNNGASADTLRTPPHNDCFGSLAIFSETDSATKNTKKHKKKEGLVTRGGTFLSYVFQFLCAFLCFLWLTLFSHLAGHAKPRRPRRLARFVLCERPGP